MKIGGQTSFRQKSKFTQAHSPTNGNLTSATLVIKITDIVTDDLQCAGPVLRNLISFHSHSARHCLRLSWSLLIYDLSPSHKSKQGGLEACPSHSKLAPQSQGMALGTQQTLNKDLLKKFFFFSLQGFSNKNLLILTLQIKKQSQNISKFLS